MKIKIQGFTPAKNYVHQSFIKKIKSITYSPRTTTGNATSAVLALSALNITALAIKKTEEEFITKEELKKEIAEITNSKFVENLTKACINNNKTFKKSSITSVKELVQKGYRRETPFIELKDNEGNFIQELVEWTINRPYNYNIETGIQAAKNESGKFEANRLQLIEEYYEQYLCYPSQEQINWCQAKDGSFSPDKWALIKNFPKISPQTYFSPTLDNEGKINQTLLTKALNIKTIFDNNNELKNLFETLDNQGLGNCITGEKFNLEKLSALQQILEDKSLENDAKLYIIKNSLDDNNTLIPEMITVLKSLAITTPEPDLTTLKNYTYKKLQQINHENIYNSLIENKKLNSSIQKLVLIKLATTEKAENLKLLNDLINDENLAPRSIFFMLKKYDYNSIQELYYSGRKPLELILFEHPNKFLESQFRNDFQNLHGEYDGYEKIEQLKKQVLKHPELYINGNNYTQEETKVAILNWFHNFYPHLYFAKDYFDSKTFDFILRLRLQKAENFLSSFQSIPLENKKLYKKLSETKSLNGKPLTPRENITLVNIIHASQKFNIKINSLNKILDTKCMDFNEIEQEFFSKIMEECGLTKEEISQIPDKKLKSWNINYMHELLPALINEDFKNIIKAANLKDFKEYITDISNQYGKLNRKNLQMFKIYNLNHDFWFNPKKSLEIRFKTTDQNSAELHKIADKTNAQMNILMQAHAKNFIKKQFPKLIQDNKFTIPNEIKNSKSELAKLLEILSDNRKQGQLYQVWARANNNLNNPNELKVASAVSTINVLLNLKQLLNDTKNIDSSNGHKDYDITIKMWDRFPQKDLFQGNFSNCCIAIGKNGGKHMSQYLTNTIFNIIEIVDNTTNEVIGNALCYFIITSSNKLALALDNIEFDHVQKGCEETNLLIRKALIKYADNIAKDVTGKGDTEIVLGGSHNDLPHDDLEKIINQKVELLGEIANPSIYLDLFKGIVYSNHSGYIMQNVNLYKLK